MGQAGHPVFAALYARLSRSMEAGPIGAARRDVVRHSRGVVVDVGSGTGANLAHLGPQVSAVHAVEPDPYMVRRLRPHLPPGAQVHLTGAEAIPLPDGSVDTVLATLTLCSVTDLVAAVAEFRRVLRPDGQVLVLEHVLARHPGVAGWQRRLRRPWFWTAGGCVLDSDPTPALAAGGFDVTGLRRFEVPGMFPTREWVTGRLVPVSGWRP